MNEQDFYHIVDGNYFCVRCQDFITDENWQIPCPGVTSERIEGVSSVTEEWLDFWRTLEREIQ